MTLSLEQRREVDLLRAKVREIKDPEKREQRQRRREAQREQRKAVQESRPPHSHHQHRGGGRPMTAIRITLTFLAVFAAMAGFLSAATWLTLRFGVVVPLGVVFAVAAGIATLLIEGERRQ